MVVCVYVVLRLFHTLKGVRKISKLKRRDNKGRILNTGESQRKDGRYTYKYVDAMGKTRYVYSWKLLPTDRMPKGKRDDLSLREKERMIQRDLFDGIDTKGSKMTLCQLYAKKIAQRPNVKKNTQQGRKYLMDALENDILGSRSIDSIKPSDARAWAIRMKERGFSYKTISNYKRSLKASFYMAIEDDVVRQIKRCSIKRFNSYCFHSCWMFRSFYPIPFWQFILRTQWLRQINCRSHQGTIQVHNH